VTDSHLRPCWCFLTPDVEELDPATVTVSWGSSDRPIGLVTMSRPSVFLTCATISGLKEFNR